MSDFKFLGNFLGKKASLPREGHDMSNQYAYSMPFASVVPVDVIDVVPGEHYNCRYSGAVQTAPMREDNFATIYNNMKAIYIPKESQLRDYARFITSDRSTRRNVQFDYDPYEVWIELTTIVQWLFPAYYLSRFYEDLQSHLDDPFNTFIDSDGFIFTIDSNGNHNYIYDGDSTDFNVFTILVNVIQQNGYNPFEYDDTTSDNWSIGRIFDYVMNNLRTDSGNLICYDAMRLLDGLGYSNILPILDSVYKTWNANMLKILSRGISIQDDFWYFVTPTSDLTGVPFNLLFVFDNIYDSINHIIRNSTDYLDMTRLFDYQYYIRMVERSNYRLPSTKVITLDSLSSKYAEDSNFFSDYFYSFSTPPEYFQLRSKHFVPSATSDPLQKNIETIHLFSSSTSAYYGMSYRIVDSGVILDNDSEVFEFGGYNFLGAMLWYLLSLHNTLLEPDLFTTMQTSVVNGNIPVIQSDLDVNVSRLNELSALYRLRQDLLRAGVRREKQMSSLFGVSEDSSLTQDIYVLDQSSSVVNIQGLLNQAETSEAPLGQRGARGNGSSGLEFQFDSKGYGTLLIVQYFTAEMFYENFKVDKQLRTNIAGRWNPYYNNLGLESVYAADCSYLSTPFDNQINLVASNNLNRSIGFSARYYEYKQRVSSVRGAFTNFGFRINPLQLNNDVLSNRYRQYPLVRGNAIYGGYLPTLIEQQVDLFSEEKDLYFNPFMVNNLFVTMTDGASHGGYDYDHFRCVLDCKVHKVSPMPKLGLLRQI